MELGERLKNLRKKKGLTLKQLADITGLSVGFLSNVERGVNSPTIVSLRKICDSLNISFFELLKPNIQEQRVVRSNARTELVNSQRSKARYEVLAVGVNKKMQPLCITLEAGGSMGEMEVGHEGEEFGYILKGKMEIEVAGETYLLEEGDSIYIEEYVPHRYRNAGPEECVSLWVVHGQVQGLLRGAD